ncbi:hypothetical protein [Flavobacterium sp. WC2509]|uniref:hypothetical protein n=1 Tax=Flavobacterium sp. WC2509 TaxID=3461406 RepID=UPI004043951B
MKNFTLLLTALVLSASHSFAQIKVTKIKSDNKNHYIANVIGYPISGLYTYVNQTSPTTFLNSDGTGIMQNEDLIKENIIWGIECTQLGVPIFKEGFNSAKYSFWYKINSKSENEDEWKLQPFSIHFDKKKMFISGERVKEYIE